MLSEHKPLYCACVVCELRSTKALFVHCGLFERALSLQSEQLFVSDLNRQGCDAADTIRRNKRSKFSPQWTPHQDVDGVQTEASEDSQTASLRLIRRIESFRETLEYCLSDSSIFVYRQYARRPGFLQIRLDNALLITAIQSKSLSVSLQTLVQPGVECRLKSEPNRCTLSILHFIGFFGNFFINYN